MIMLKNEKEIDGIKESGKYLKGLFEELDSRIKAGMSTFEVDKIAHDYMKKHNCGAPCLGYYGYPAATCVSVNDTVIHGIPSRDIVLKDGDLVSVDITLEKNGFISDSTHTYEIGIVSDEVHLLNERTRKALYLGIEKAGEKGSRLFDIASAIEKYISQFGYGIVREYCGHGVGFEMHEDPAVPNWGSPGSGPLLRPGMALAIEPMVLMGSPRVRVLKDGWTAVSRDGKPTAHYENTVVVAEDGPLVITLQEKERTK